ncbi:hypothetical protein MNBD_GAMMA10-703 [hydrothermal vent metagenome]|uniref:DUF2169 domain-containing protein n=1 Tax=hydrothermal vent metagenome TaxID=652676 RepID=A0A3B0Y861_9ZZZZ
MLQLKNGTPFASSIALFPDEQGTDSLYLMVKASFNIGSSWTLADKQLAPIAADEYWGEPDKSSLKSASDFHTGKPATDIIMLGSAHAPDNEPVRQLDVSLQVGQVNKTVRVFGDRQWMNGRITAPEPFQTMPMVYERAYGGVYAVDGQIISQEDRNPVGNGFAGQRTQDEMNGMALPNLEDPASLIRQYTDQPAPSCFALSSPGWLPRRSHAGTYDIEWEQQRAPYLPVDYNSRFLNMAHSDLIYPGYISGGEQVMIRHMHPAGDLQFTLPRINLASTVLFGEQELSTAFNLETLIIEPEQMKLSMLWRSSVSCDKKILKIRQIEVALSR